MAQTHEERRVAGLRSQLAPTEISAFACTQCAKPYLDACDARECCACASCGTKFPHTDINQYRCGHCERPFRVHNIREGVASQEFRVRREQRALDTRKAHLAEMLATPRPPKGSPREK